MVVMDTAFHEEVFSPRAFCELQRGSFEVHGRKSAHLQFVRSFRQVGPDAPANKTRAFSPRNVTSAAAMFSLQKMLGKDDKFFELLQASAREGVHSVEALKRILTNPDATPTLDEFSASRRKDKAITNQISELLVKTFVTALEREDIESLSNVLYKVPKTIEKFAERYILCAPRVREVNFDTALSMLEEAAGAVVKMLEELKANNLPAIAKLNARLQQIEGDADKLMLERLRELYSGKYDPVTVIALKDLFELLERVFDRCRDAGNVVSLVVLKNA
jgi:uncharacterized protein